MANNRRGHRGRGGRPARGGIPPGEAPLVEGDTGIAAGPQGGAADPPDTAAGDLAAREFGVPQADIPGGLKHLVNAPTVPAQTVDKPERPADYHKEHGVEVADWGQYDTPAGRLEHDGHSHAPDLRVIPDNELAIPVYQVEGPHGTKRLVSLITEGPVTVPSPTLDPVRLANRDPSRRKFWITNETTPASSGATGPGIRIGDWETTADGRGLLVPAGQMKDLFCQDDVYATNQSGTAITISWGVETSIPATRPDNS